MRNFTIFLVIIFLALYFGYPKYQEYSFIKELRETMRNEAIKTPDLRGLPISAELKNEYPRNLMTLKFVGLKYNDIPASDRAKIREEIKLIPCRNLEVFRGSGEAYLKALAKIFEEDKNSMNIVVRDKDNMLIADHDQIISECTNFESFKSGSL